MLRTTAASLLALATAIFPAQAQTVLYGEPPTARPVYPQPQPYFPNQQQAQPPLGSQPLYYESVPSAQPLQPPVIYQPEQEVRRFRPIAPQGNPSGVMPTRPLAPVERYRPPQPPPQALLRQDEFFVEPPTMPSPPAQAPAVAAPPMIARPEPRAEAPSEARRETVRKPIPEPAMAEPELMESEALRDFSDELARIVALGERYRAASPGFLEDLKALSERYRDLPVRADVDPERSSEQQVDLVGPPPPAEMPEDPDESTPEMAASTDQPEMAMMSEDQPTPDTMAEPEPAMAMEPAPEPQELPQALPPTSAAIVYLRDDFSDGEYLSNPAWNVRQGQFVVDPAYGLRPFLPETTEPAQVTPQALLQYLIGEGKPETPEPTGDSGASLIEAQTDIGNAFSLVATITDHGGEGAAHFIVHQGGANWLGYRLELRAGPRPLVVLARRGSSGYKDIMKVEAPGFSTGKPHQLRWARLSDGQMFVLIDGRPIITARDTVFQQGWKGFGYFTAEADVSMRNIRIAEPVER